MTNEEIKKIVDDERVEQLTVLGKGRKNIEDKHQPLAEMLEVWC